jgi:hypothetical protein
MHTHLTACKRPVFGPSLSAIDIKLGKYTQPILLGDEKKIRDKIAELHLHLAVPASLRILRVAAPRCTPTPPATLSPSWS